MTNAHAPSPPGGSPQAESDPILSPPCVLVFNANDPTGASGLACDVVSVASVGAHALPVATGVYARDTARTFDFFPLPEEAVTEQARAVLEDAPVQLFKVGFAGSPENLSAIAELATDYSELPLVAHMPDLSWWEDDKIDQYQDAFRELLLPQTTVLIGNHNTLCRWLLPDWASDKIPSPRDLARAAADMGTPYTVVTGIGLPEQYVENVLATPQAVLASERFERFDVQFIGAGDTFSAALAAVLAAGSDLPAAFKEALQYLDHSLEAGFRPGMGQAVPDRLFWAQPEDDEEDEGASDSSGSRTPDILQLPLNETKH